MTAPPIRTATTEAPSPARPQVWICLEGTNGVGKTLLAHLLAQRLGPDCALIYELPDAPRDQLPGQVIAALAARQDPFLRTGFPLAETFALLGLAVRRREDGAESASFVVEDRGVDSVAIYQSLTLSDEEDEDPYPLARRLLTLAEQWRPANSLTVLLKDTTAACRGRMAERLGRTLTNAEHGYLERAARLYDRLADAEPGRYLVLDRARLSLPQVLDVLIAAIPDAARPDGVPL
ncbi:MAG: dTMP kinase [Pseudonocardiaceae bacterium]